MLFAREKCACVRVQGGGSVYTPVAFSELRLTRRETQLKKTFNQDGGQIFRFLSITTADRSS